MDVKKLNEDITKHFQNSISISQDDKNKYFFHIHGAYKLCLATSNKGTLGVFDNEMVGSIVMDDKVHLNVSKVRKDGSGFEMFASLRVSIDVGDIGEYINGELSIKDFMDKRYNYNSRLRSNQKEMVQFISAE